MLRVLGEAPAEPGWRVVLGSGGASPYCEIARKPINRHPGPESRHLIPQLLNSCNSWPL
jgi:hypothetical protein